MAIGIRGSGRLVDYVDCLEESLEVIFEIPNNSINLINSTLPVSYTVFVRNV